MGTSGSPTELEAKLTKFAARVERLPDSAANKAASFVKETIIARSPSRLRGVGKRGAKLGVRYNVSHQQALVYATGPWQLIEWDTKPHRIPRERSRGRQRYAVIPGVGVRAWANHPGTKGKHPFEQAAVVARPYIPKIYQEDLVLVMRETF